MSESHVKLEELLDAIRKCDGYPMITMVDPVYDEVYDVVGFSSAHNLESFYAILPSTAMPLISLDEFFDDLDYDNSEEGYDSIDYYTLWVLPDADADVQDAMPVNEIAIADGENRIILFV